MIYLTNAHNHPQNSIIIIHNISYPIHSKFKKYLNYQKISINNIASIIVKSPSNYHPYAPDKFNHQKVLIYIILEKKHRSLKRNTY
jgi:hypothetical protein